ncbi:hypothetical protein Tco_0320429 [Tanacetum coccineum]
MRSSLNFVKCRCSARTVNAFVIGLSVRKSLVLKAQVAALEEGTGSEKKMRIILPDNRDAEEEGLSVFGQNGSSGSPCPVIILVLAVDICLKRLDTYG